MGYTTSGKCRMDFGRRLSKSCTGKESWKSRSTGVVQPASVQWDPVCSARRLLQWKGLKKEWYGASSSLHARFQKWNKAGLWKKMHRAMVGVLA